MSKELTGIAKVWESTVKRAQVSAKRRSNNIFGTMSVANVDDDDGDDDDKDDGDDDDNDDAATDHVEKVFPNGDVYTGQWEAADGFPDGHGKYVWADGCMYIGRWSMGKTMGKGKFSWPSGAIYEGQFKNNFMDGEGTYTGSLAEVYKGSWAFDMRHGMGARSYDNGDHYDGQWRRGVPDGKGYYQWKNGNQYIGHWRQGKMHGTGSMIWANGNQYDGSWANGVPRGHGKLRWADGSFYVGVWSDDPQEQSGTYYPSTASPAGSLDWDPQELLLLNLNDCRINPGERIPIYPSQKLFNWSSKEDPWSNDRRSRPLSMDGMGGNNGYSQGSESDSLGSSSECIAYGREMDGGMSSEEADGCRRPEMIIKPAKRQGQTILKGHKHYELMLNLQLGIRHAVGRPAPSVKADHKTSAFDPNDKVWTRFPPEGSKHTPPHPSCDFRWKDYCPSLFRTLRKLFKVDPADYMISICGNEALRELSSPGKSGSFFYLTSDDKYMIKTMKKSEVKVLKRMLPAYYNHVKAYENTLVTKFFGLHCVKLSGAAQKKVRFVIMGNLFCTDYAIHRRFDLKGSSQGRLTVKPESDIDTSTTLKDLDLNFIFRLQKSCFQEFCRQVDQDCDFLEKERIMDYSLLVGIHFREISHNGEPLSTRRARSSAGSGNQTPEARQADSLHDTKWSASVRLGSNMPSRAELTVRRNKGDLQLVGTPTGEFYDIILVFGVIDILQDYDISKKLEHAYKSFQHDPISISAVDPRQYSKRFRHFLLRIFKEDT